MFRIFRNLIQKKKNQEQDFQKAKRESTLHRQEMLAEIDKQAKRVENRLNSTRKK